MRGKKGSIRTAFVRAVIQRVKKASVKVDGEEISHIGPGLCCLIGIETSDGPVDIDYLARKMCSLRIFDDASGVMNLDVSEVKGDILLISQFTLLGDARKGRRPSYSNAELPQEASPIFEDLVLKVRDVYAGKVETGRFQADMDVEIINHGPVTILLDSRKLF
jgi:D-tyrosyl-tRNA(Tyr) deacylase